jgi:hypothetical protein
MFSLVEIMALLYTWNEHNGYLCCPDHAHFGPSLSHFVIRANIKSCAINLVNYNHILVGRNAVLLFC